MNGYQHHRAACAAEARRNRSTAKNHAAYFRRLTGCDVFDARTGGTSPDYAVVEAYRARMSTYPRTAR